MTCRDIQERSPAATLATTVVTAVLALGAGSIAAQVPIDPPKHLLIIQTYGAGFERYTGRRAPSEVLVMIVAVVTAAATMQAAGGFDYLVTLSGRPRRSPAAARR